MALCLFCSKNFEKYDLNNYYCSSLCEQKYKYKSKKMKCWQNKCFTCKKYFITLKPKKIFCKDLCRKEGNIIKGFLNNKSNNIPRFFIFKRDNFKCIYCGKTSLEDGIKLQIDHIIPKDKKGTDSIYNLVTSCRDCNVSKNKNKVPNKVLIIVRKRNKSCFKRN